MKYIRTSGGIYEVEKKERAYFEGQPWLYYCKGKYGLVEEKDILKQADTLEELIDGYVIVDTTNKNSKPRFQEESYEKPPLHLLKDGYEIYGSIWINNNLVKFAKMNGKGTLESL